MSIAAENLRKTYGRQNALDGFSLHAQPGQIYGLLGPNGAGKSTFMKILCGLIPADEGAAQVCGLDCATDSLAVRQQVGYLPEHNPLYPDLYVTEYLHYVADLYQVPRERAEQLIADVGLSPERHKRIGELSKGYRQRVGMAQVLLHEPDVLILDEPTSGLDPNQIREVRETIRRLGQSKTILLSTHILQEVEALADRVILIAEGRVRFDGPPAELRRDGRSLDERFHELTRSA
jgi:ABC-2 type transport system ATP-binding protein